MIFYILHDDVMQLLNETARPVGHRTSDIGHRVHCCFGLRSGKSYSKCLRRSIGGCNHRRQ